MPITYIHLDTLPSTQDWAKKERASFNKESLVCVVAKKQTKGRGKLLRPWISSEGDISATYCFYLPRETKDLFSLAQLLSLSLVRLLLQRNLSPQLKWPNDILLSKKKLAGILCETSLEGSDYQVFLGLGMNVNQDFSSLQKIDQPATSLWVETNQKENPLTLLEELEPFFLEDLALFREKGFSAFYKEYQAFLVFLGEKIRCLEGKKVYEGLCEGINSSGALLLRTLEGSLKTLYSADILYTRV